jgi:hypothetical protein
LTHRQNVFALKELTARPTKTKIAAIFTKRIFWIKDTRPKRWSMKKNQPETETEQKIGIVCTQWWASLLLSVAPLFESAREKFRALV